MYQIHPMLFVDILSFDLWTYGLRRKYPELFQEISHQYLNPNYSVLIYQNETNIHATICKRR